LKLTKSGIWIPQRGAVSPETAPRPHWITVALGLLSPVIGFVAFWVSLQSYKTAQQALQTSQQSLKVGQRAYLSVLEVKYSDAQLRVHLKNSGNTPARIQSLGLRLVAIEEAKFFDLQNRWLRAPTDTFFGEVKRLSSPLAVINATTEVAGKEDAWLKVGCDPSIFPGDLHLPNPIDVAALIKYRDVFNDPHPLTWGWRMKGLTITDELNHFSTDLLLIQHFPGEIDIGSTEQIEDIDDIKRQMEDFKKQHPDRADKIEELLHGLK
jgi:hypothetical protein